MQTAITYALTKPKKKPKILSSLPRPVYLTVLPTPLLISNIRNITTINKLVPKIKFNTYSLSVKEFHFSKHF